MNFLWLKEDPVKDADQALARARAGMAFLDQKFGPGWEKKIDLDRLNVKSPINCIVGQLMRKRHLSLLKLSCSEGVRYGVSCGAIDMFCWIPIPAVNRSFKRLTHAWKVLIRERRGCSNSDIVENVVPGSTHHDLPKRLAVTGERDATSAMTGNGPMWTDTPPAQRRLTSQRTSRSQST